MLKYLEKIIVSLGKTVNTLDATRSSSIKASLRDLNCQSELLLVDLFIMDGTKITMGVYYRPPNSNLQPLEDLRDALDNISTTTNLILLGDFNLSEFDWVNNRPLTNSEHHTLLQDIVHENFLSQIVNEPTRDQNILDLLLTTNVDLINNIEVGEPFSDHNMITFTINVTPYQSRVSKKDIYAF